MELGSQLTQGYPMRIHAAATLNGVVNTAAVHTKHTAQFGSWIPLAQRLDQRY